jgi:hypothetical protein
MMVIIVHHRICYQLYNWKEVFWCIHYHHEGNYLINSLDHHTT